MILRNVILCGDALTELRKLPDESVQMCVTSPPYWGLRSYAIPPQVWGGKLDCVHNWCTEEYYTEKTVAVSSISAFSKPGQSNVNRLKQSRWRSDDTCIHCGAWRGSLGLEPTPEYYVAHLVEIFREVWRVLRKDGVLFLNLGDSYAGSWGAMSHDLQGEAKRTGMNTRPPTPFRNVGLKPKDLVGIPRCVAFALRADGWYLRQDIIWSKLNPLPESVNDRCTKSHEYIFLLTKSSKYYYDNDAIADARPRSSRPNTLEKGNVVDGKTYEKRNRRSVWTIPLSPIKESHFAVFPPEIPKLCIKAGTSERGACPKCSAPWERITDRTTHFAGGSGKAGRTSEEVNAYGKWAGRQYGENIKLGPVVTTMTLGWRPSCKCYGVEIIEDMPPKPTKKDAEAVTDFQKRWYAKWERLSTIYKTLKVVPCIVLDPFAGSGTTPVVARRMGRDYIGIELSETYVKTIIEPRLANINPLFDGEL